MALGEVHHLRALPKERDGKLPLIILYLENRRTDLVEHKKIKIENDNMPKNLFICICVRELYTKLRFAGGCFNNIWMTCTEKNSKSHLQLEKE